MKNYNELQSLLNTILELSKDIIADLQQEGDLKLIIVKMERRNNLIIELVDKSPENDRGELISNLLLIKDEEDKMMIPHRQEFENVKRALIQLNHSRGYGEFAD